MLLVVQSSAILLTAQNKPYFQQKVDYKIAVSLDDKKHTLTGKADISYQNNAPEPLSKITFLLQPNAYKSKLSAFAKQQLRNGSTRFYFAEPSEMGGLSGLDFRLDGKKLEVDIDATNADIAVVTLPQPLASGASATISTPFVYKMPYGFSRGGHYGQQYLATQWFPKPAVFDADGWHPQPYLDQGEFYADFGNYDVSITLPENYVVGATGVLQTASEVAFLKKKAADTEGLLSIKNAQLKIKNESTPSF